MADTRNKLLEHFDEDVHARFKAHLDDTKHQIDRFGGMFWGITKKVLANDAGFDDDELLFMLEKAPKGVRVESGVYHLISKERKNERGRYLYRPSHPLGEYVVDRARDYDLTQTGNVVFDITNHPTRISVIEALKGKSGVLRLDRLSIRSFDDDEYLQFTAISDDGQELDQETCENLFDCTAHDKSHIDTPPKDYISTLKQLMKARTIEAIKETEARNQHHFNEEREKLDKWVRDVEIAAEKELKDTKTRIRELQREANRTTDMDEQLKLQQRIRELEKKKRKFRRDIFDIQDEAEEKRDQLIDNLRKRMEQESSSETLFTVRWRVE